MRGTVLIATMFVGEALAMMFDTKDAVPAVEAARKSCLES